MGIVFEPLLEGGHVSGEASLALPALQVVAVEAAGGTAIVELPLLELTAEGFEHLMGSASIELPAMELLATEPAGGSAVLELPAFTLQAFDGDGLLVPEGGSAAFDLPAIEASGTMAVAIMGSAVLELPPFELVAVEAAGGSAVLTLPAFTGAAIEAIPAGGRITLLQHAGVLYFSAGPMATKTALDTIGFSDSVSVQLGRSIYDTFALTSEAHASAVLLQTIGDNLRLQDAVRFAWGIAASDTVQLLDTAAAVKLVTALCADVLRLTDLADGKLQAQMAVLSGFALADRAGVGWNVSAVDTLDFAATVSALARISQNLEDGFELSDAAAGSLRATVVIGDAFEITDAALHTLRASQLIADGFTIGLTLRFGDEEYFAYVLHGAPIDEFGTRPVAEYRNYPFNAFFKMGLFDFATGPGGVYRLGGDTDAGVPIEAWLRSGLSDLGTSQLKRTPDFFLAVSGDEDPLYIKVIHRTPETGALTEDWFELVPAPSGAPLPTRARVARGFKSLFYGYELRNIDGRDFTVQQMRFYPLILDKSTH